jgi:hypothetical protein
MKSPSMCIETVDNARVSVIEHLRLDVVKCPLNSFSSFNHIF